MSASVATHPSGEEDVMERAADATAFIVGPARSGTSLLYKTLCLHPDVAYVSNWVARYPMMPQLAVLDRFPRAFPTLRRDAWFADDANAYVYGTARSLVRRSFPTPVEGEPLYTRSGVARPGGPTPRSVAPATELPKAFATIRRFGGGSVLVSKRIANNLRIPLLADVFPEARFVFLVRDGRAVAASLSRVDWWPDSHVWWYGGSPRRWAAEGRDPWEICARNWVEELDQIGSGLADVPETQVLRLRYEDLVAEPAATLERVAAFVGLAPDAAWRRGIAELAFPDRTEAWRSVLDPATVARISRIQQEELARYGYA
jgi:omega-hydroxy-beta-dihydromenaquinone-9 sulfotransferase